MDNRHRGAFPARAQPGHGAYRRPHGCEPRDLIYPAAGHGQSAGQCLVGRQGLTRVILTDDLGNAYDTGQVSSTSLGQADYRLELSTIRIGGAHVDMLVDDVLVTQSINVATEPAGTYFIHADHLNTPQVLTDDTQDTVWQAYTPFGEATITTEVVANNLRFPGQYYDAETGLHYNYFRTYDPSIGRYITSDPIGLDGGISTYAYVGGNPLFWIDPKGLYSLKTALNHYFFGNGETIHVPFAEVDIGLGANNIDFPGYDALVQSMYRKDGTLPVVLRSKAHDIGDLVFGNMKYDLRGTIKSNKCSWSFEGSIGAEDDVFDFDSKPWGKRDWYKEIITRGFANVPGGTPFTLLSTVDEMLPMDVFGELLSIL